MNDLIQRETRSGADASRRVILESRDVWKEFRIESNRLEVLKGITLPVYEGETLSIMGASGAGKSTLLHILGGLDRPTKGTVVFDERDVYRMSALQRNEYRANRVGFIFQAYYLLPELDVLENVMLPCMRRLNWLRRAAHYRERARELLSQVGLGERAHHRPTELSGGEQQRAAIARSLMNEPDIVLADEPTGNLDSKTGEQVLHYLFELTCDQGRTLVLVTHNETIAALCGRNVQVVDGRIASEEGA